MNRHPLPPSADTDGAAALPRRHVLLAGTALAAWPALPLRAQLSTDPAYAATEARAREAIAHFLRGAEPQRGGITLDLAELVENGNTVPLRVQVDSPMTAADHVREIALFTHRNPQPEVASFDLGPHNGRAEVHTRIRLATSQRVTALARLSDGRCRLLSVDVVVTLAACVEN